ncbi:hypothetical protein [Arhodomonas sp. AD133]|uniref:hypothetical protein n=1 Tax=Arhodomonas sp. AD133 TaxID=3415009 RepID=UPI003EB896B5
MPMASGFSRTLIVVALGAFLLATASAQPRPLADLVDALNRTQALERETQSLSGDELTSAARVACRILNDMAGERLNTMLERAYDNLHAQYDDAKRLLQRSAGEGSGFADALRDALRAGNATAGHVETLVARLQAVRTGNHPEVTVSYSVPLHVDELAKRACEVYRWRHDQGKPDEGKDRRVVAAALDGLVGLTLIAAGDRLLGEKGGEAAAMAGAATAIGSVMIAGAYRDLYR